MDEKMKVNKVDGKKLNVKEKSFLIIGGVIAIASMTASYRLGEKAAHYKINIGLNTCFKHDPSLETHMEKVLNEVNSKSNK